MYDRNDVRGQCLQEVIIMAGSAFYVQECPTCGRRLQIRVEYLGRIVVCQHCQGRFSATDPVNARYDCPEFENALLQRANELLKSIAKREVQPHSPNPR
jgi:hypothetical protein